MRIAAQIRSRSRSLALLAVARARRAAASAGSSCSCAQLPSYQDEMQAWVTAELGLALDYTRLDARLGLARPGARVPRRRASRTAGDATPFLTARGASVGFERARSRCCASRRAASSASTGSRSTAPSSRSCRTADGAYRLQGAPRRQRRAGDSVQVPPDIDVLVRDSRVLYLDAARSVAWDFQDVAGSMRRDDDVLTLEASARPPAEFADRIEVDGAGRSSPTRDDAGAQFTGDWRLSADVDDVDLAVAARLFPPSAVVPQAGRGDVAFWLEWQEGELASGTVELALADVALQSALGAVDSRFERIALPATGSATATRGAFALRDVAVTRARPRLARSGDRRHRRRARRRRRRRASRCAAASCGSRTDAVLRAAAGVALARVVVRARAARRPARRRHRARRATRDDGIDYTVAARVRRARHRRRSKACRASRAHGPGARRLAHADGSSSRARTRRSTGPRCSAARSTCPSCAASSSGAPGQDAVRVVSDDLLRRDAGRVAALESRAHAADGRQLAASSICARRVSEFDVAAVQRYLPANKMPPTVVAWLDSRAARRPRDERRASRSSGRVRAFPFDGGEGEFRATVDVEDGQLAFISDWPLAEDLDGTVEFVNASFAARGSGRMLGNRTADVRVGIGDLRAGDFTLQADTIGGARSGARVLEQRAADRALPRRGLRAARSAERHGRRERRSRVAAAQSRRVSPDGGARHHRRRARVPRLRPARHRDPGLARARRRRAARRGHPRRFSSTGP